MCNSPIGSDEVDPLVLARFHEFVPRVEGGEEHEEHEMEIEREKIQTHTNTVSGYPSRTRITHPIESQRERLARQMIEL